MVLWGAWPFHRAAWTNLRHGAATMDTLISVGVLARTCGRRGRCSRDPSQHLYFEVAAVVTTFILAGRFFEARAKTQSGAALRALLDMGAKDVAVDARRIRRSTHSRRANSRSVTSSWCDPGRRSRPTASSPAARRRSTSSMLTGESVPVEVGPGDDVVGATVNVGGLLHVRATRVGADTQLAQMARLVADAQSGKAEVAAAGGSGVGDLRSGRDRVGAADARRAGWSRAAHRARRSPPPSRC